MRPEILNRYFIPVSSVSGIGPKTARLFARLFGLGEDEEPKLIRLLTHIPSGVIDRRNMPEIAFAAEGAIVTLKVRVDRHQPSPSGRPNVPHRVFCHDETGEIGLVYFRAKPAWLEKLYPIGETVLVSGKMEWFNGRPTMVHPDQVMSAEDLDKFPLIEPVYPLTSGLGQRQVAKAIHAALEGLPVLPEWQDAAFVRNHTFKTFNEALADIHSLSDPIDLEEQSPLIRRLAYDEFLAGQLAISLVRRRLRRVVGTAMATNGTVTAVVRAALPFQLTSSQETAIAEISADMAAPDKMIRLLQGDVGSGKTVVALMAMAQAAENGFQSALMAPTEVLARQHFATLEPLARAAGMRLAILTSREKGREREEILRGLADGSFQVVVGTHALFQEAVVYHRLGLAVVDEQHRFGVHQRLALSAKGEAADLLVMTATPIPRTLVLTAFGDMDVSRLTDKPAGRQPIKTVSLPFERMEEVIDRIGSALKDGKKAYWICPLVEETEETDATAAIDRYRDLQDRFGNRVALVHGRMSGQEKDAAMASFKSGETRVLVATTVVEVGVDVPDATIMVIEHAERFGLSQLHQLRGRIGRGSEASVCLLLYRGPLGETARRRIEIMRETEDGFRIAEEDLKLRGEGEILGTRQSGTPGFRIASLSAHVDLLESARADSRLILETDPDLKTPRGEALRLLLYLFEKDQAIKLLTAG
ncbi:MAG: ATP-dependent DNA helicase RecG [Rhizobiaceae bacterium]